MDAVVQQASKLVDDAVARRDRTLPTWAAARLTRLLRGLDSDARATVVERVCDRPNVPESLAEDVRGAAERANNPAPALPAPPPPPSTPTPRPRTAVAPRRERTPAPARGVKTTTFKGRDLSGVPAGVEVTYQGRRATVEPPFLVFEGGRRFQFLKPAAAYVNGGVEVDAWNVWKVADGRSMAECYDSGDWPLPE